MATTTPHDRTDSALARYLPILRWLPAYDRSWLRPDLIAGLTVWALVVPQAIAYAGIAGLPPEAGLFATFAGLLGYAIFGTSRQMVVSPTSSTAAISASLVAGLAISDPERFWDASAALALLCGVAFIILGLLGAGFVSQFIATAVQAGLMFGLGMTIIVGQIPKMLGVSGSEGTFFEQLDDLLRNLGDTNGWTVAIGVASLAALLLLKRFLPLAPAALIVVAATTILTTLFSLDERGVAIVGEVSSEIPLPNLPSVTWDHLVSLLPGALAIAIIGFAESNSVAEEFAERHRYRIRPNQELLAIGAANLLSGFFRGFITGGGASQSAANDAAGARSQMSSLIVCALTFITAIALMPLFKDLPSAALGAIVISAVMGFLKVRELQRIRSLRRDSFIFAMIALFGVLILGIVPGLLVAITLSLLTLLGRIARPSDSIMGRMPDSTVVADIERYPEAVPLPGLLIYRLDAPLLFMNTAVLRERVRELVAAADPPPRAVLLDLAASNDLDIKGLDTLRALHTELAEAGQQLWLAGIHGQADVMLHRSGVAELIGEERILRTVNQAVAAYNAARTTTP